MSWCLSQDTDVPATERYLLAHVQSSMLALASLREICLNGTTTRSIKLWMTRDPVHGAFAISNKGRILFQCPDVSDTALPAAAGLVHDHRVIGLAGEARSQGVARAVLFAASDTATRACQAIGFAPTGPFLLVLFKPEKEVAA